MSLLSRKTLAPYIWECTGTFALCYTVGTAGTHNSTATNYDRPLVGLAVGTVLGVMVYLGGAISGGHYNPAVTLGAVIAGATTPLDGVLYSIAQLTGSFIGGGLAYATRGDDAGYPLLDMGISHGQAFLLEFLFTMFLVITVLNTAVAEATKGNNYFGFAIGSALFVGATSIGPYTGAALNPAVGLGVPLAVAGTANWVHVFAPLLGGIVGGLKYLHNHPAPDVLPRDLLSDVRAWLHGNYSKKRSEFWNEFTGTFYLCLTISTAAAGFEGNLGASPVAPLAIGSSLMVAVYFGGHISGGHYNPAVSVGLALIRKFPARSLPKYLIAQIGASFAAGGVAFSSLHGVAYEVTCGYPEPDKELAVVRSVVAEATFTFLLVTAVMFSATTRRTHGNSFFGFCIGMTVFVGAVSVGGVSGGAFNPAVGTGLPICCGKASDIWIYWASDFLGAGAAAIFYIMTSPEDFEAGLEAESEKSVTSVDIDSSRLMEIGDMNDLHDDHSIGYVAADDMGV